jgi:hypothetical protein
MFSMEIVSPTYFSVIPSKHDFVALLIVVIVEIVVTNGAPIIHRAHNFSFNEDVSIFSAQH